VVSFSKFKKRVSQQLLKHVDSMVSKNLLKDFVALLGVRSDIIDCVEWDSPVERIKFIVEKMATC